MATRIIETLADSGTKAGSMRRVYYIEQIFIRTTVHTRQSYAPIGSDTNIIHHTRRSLLFRIKLDAFTGKSRDFCCLLIDF